MGFSTGLHYVSLDPLRRRATNRLGGEPNIEKSQFVGAVNVPHVCNGSTTDGVAQSLHEQSHTGYEIVVMNPPNQERLLVVEVTYDL